MAGKSKKAPSEVVNELEKEYAKLLKVAEQVGVSPVIEYPESLEQPSLLKVVETVTTYGAYEEPI